MSPRTILVCDDEPDIRELLRELLGRTGYDVLEAADGQEALRTLYGSAPDLVLLDVSMPNLDGWATLERIRDVSDVPVIMLTARTEELERVRGLKGGADDYVTKPFSIQELLARVRAHLRRAPERTESAIAAGDFVIDAAAHSVEVMDKPLHLTPKEFELLVHLARHAGKVITHRSLLTSVWGAQSAHQPEYLRVFVGQLRKKLEAETGKQYIQTEPWIGYRFVPEGLSGRDEPEA